LFAIKLLGELMNKNALRFLVASALLSPATLYALGLGEIRLNSALNQPFDADIEVVSAAADELDSLKVALASDDTFRRYGLDRPNFLSNFSLRVDGANSARPTIKVRSTNAVSEPFLNLLVEVSWTGGRVLREYTVLLDPPVMGPAATVAPVQAPLAAAAATPTPAGAIVRAAPAAAASSNNTNAAPASSARAAVNPGESYTVRPADTLSKIANAISQGNSARQTMLAVYRANPQAFVGNMNVLRSGAVLRRCFQRRSRSGNQAPEWPVAQRGCCCRNASSRAVAAGACGTGRGSQCGDRGR
jgi:pilus assembly protein FimV